MTRSLENQGFSILYQVIKYVAFLFVILSIPYHVIEYVETLILQVFSSYLITKTL